MLRLFNGRVRFSPRREGEESDAGCAGRISPIHRYQQQQQQQRWFRGRNSTGTVHVLVRLPCRVYQWTTRTRLTELRAG